MMSSPDTEPDQDEEVLARSHTVWQPTVICKNLSFAEDEEIPLPVPARSPLVRSQSTPTASTFLDDEVPFANRMQRSTSADAAILGGELLNRETHCLAQELAHHTDLVDRQLKELCWRLNVDMQDHDRDGLSTHNAVVGDPDVGHETDSPIPGPETSELVAVLKEFGLSAQPDALRSELQVRLRAPRGSGISASGGDVTREASKATLASTSTLRTPKADSPEAQNGMRSRIEIRHQIFRFLELPANRVRVLKLWRKEVEIAKGGEWLQREKPGDTWYERLYNAFEQMFDNILDENDSPIRGVLFNLLSEKAKAAPAGFFNGRPVQIEQTKKDVRGFVDAVLAIALNSKMPFEKRLSNQWEDCLCRLHQQFEEAIEDIFLRIPRSEMNYRTSIEEGNEKLTPTQAIQRTLSQNSVNALHLEMASQAVASHVANFEKVAFKNPQQFWKGYLQQAISVNKTFLQLVREMTLLTGLWTLGNCNEGEHMTSTVMNREYRRVRRGLYTLLISHHGEIVDSWIDAIRSRCSSAMTSFEDSSLSRTILASVIEWLRTGYNAHLRAPCIYMVETHLKAGQKKDLNQQPQIVPPPEVSAETQKKRREELMEKGIGTLFHQAAMVPGVSQKDTRNALDLQEDRGEEVVKETLIDLILGTPIPQGEEEDADADAGEQQLIDTFPLFKEVVLEIFRREVVVKANTHLSFVDEPRVLDILARLTNELGKHLDSEWHMALWHRKGKSKNLDVLPPAKIFQVTDWKEGQRFNFEAVKTEFLSSVIQSRYVVERYVARGAVGRVWQVKDQDNISRFPLCLKTFFCEPEREEFFEHRETYLKNVMEELCQVDRWMTSCSRLCESDHIVKVVKVFRDAEIQRPKDGVEGSINGILMEFCDKGELTSYLWDKENAQKRAFDEKTAQFLFAQLIYLLQALFQPSGLSGGGTAMSSFTNDDDYTFTPFSIMTSPDTTLAETTPLTNVRPSASCDSVKIPTGSSGSVDSFKRFLCAEKGKKYFHNDIKLENLVVTGTTLKLIDFQSIQPLNGNEPLDKFQHATQEYQHQCPEALSEHDTVESRAERVAIWAIGVILTRLLAAPLEPEWVRANQGLGAQADLAKVLPPEHCLLNAKKRNSPRNLLDRIFSKDDTPLLAELVRHPWVTDGCYSLTVQPIKDDVQSTLEKIQKSFTETNIGWIQMSCYYPCINDQDPPIDKVQDILSTAMDLDNRTYYLKGKAQKPRRFAQQEAYPVWSIGINDEGDDATDSISPIVASGESAARRRWQKGVEAMFSDRFEVTLRPRDDADCEEDGQADVWWLSVKWLPAMTYRGNEASKAQKKADSSHFVQVRKLIVQAIQMDTDTRQEEDNKRRRSTIKSTGPLLPLFG